MYRASSLIVGWIVGVLLFLSQGPWHIGPLLGFILGGLTGTISGWLIGNKGHAADKTINVILLFVLLIVVIYTTMSTQGTEIQILNSMIEGVAIAGIVTGLASFAMRFLS